MITVGRRSRPTHSVEFVIAHHHFGGALLVHGSNRVDDGDLLGATVDEVADEDHPSSGVAKGAGVVSVSESMQQFDKMAVAAVDVPDDVVPRGGAIDGSNKGIHSNNCHAITIRRG